MNSVFKDAKMQLLLYKLFSIAIISGYFFIGYFFVANLDVSKTYSAEIFLDSIIPFTPIFIIFYIFGDFLSFMSILFLDAYSKIKSATISYAIMMTIAFIVFWLYPIEIIRTPIVEEGIFSFITKLRIGLDTSRNALPSLHVALGVLSWMIIRSENKNVSNWLFVPTILMILSTLFVKQHVVLDAITGAFLALAVYFLIYLNLCKYFKNKTTLV